MHILHQTKLQTVRSRHERSENRKLFCPWSVYLQPYVVFFFFPNTRLPPEQREWQLLSFPPNLPDPPMTHRLSLFLLVCKVCCSCTLKKLDNLLIFFELRVIRVRLQLPAQNPASIRGLCFIHENQSFSESLRTYWQEWCRGPRIIIIGCAVRAATVSQHSLRTKPQRCVSLSRATVRSTSSAAARHVR